MNEQIESQNSLFANMKKNNKRRTVAYSCVLACVLLRFCGFRSSTQKLLNHLIFCVLSRVLPAKKSAYSCA